MRLGDRLEAVETIAILMLENRSFDHLLGTLPGVDGIASAFACSGTAPFPLGSRPLTPSYDLPPHEREAVASQIAGGAMDGFVESWRQAAPGDGRDAMGHLTALEAPVSHFLARHFTVCDRWFSALPTSTQPNRLMALGGESLRDRTREDAGDLLRDQKLVFDWLDAAGVPWRVYHDGFPFLTLMPGQHARILGGAYRRLSHLADDVASEPDATFPKVIFVEPSFTGIFGPANDGHPPQPMSFAEELLRRVYLALTCNPRRWERTLFAVTYDEHGGFYDHVPPPRIPTPKPRDADPDYRAPFESLGVRVPAIVASPLVGPGVCHALFDHTSALKLVTERFSLPERELPALDRRAGEGRERVRSLAALPWREGSVLPVPVPPRVTPAAPVPLDRPVPEVHVEAIQRLWARDPARAGALFPELLQPVL